MFSYYNKYNYSFSKLKKKSIDAFSVSNKSAYNNVRHSVSIN